MAGAAASRDFEWSTSGEPHALRRKEMLRKYGEEIRKLYGYDGSTAFWSLLVASVQVAIAIAARDLALWKVLLLGWVVGGVFANHTTAALHECCHYLVFRTPAYNKYLAYIINCSLAIPAASGFRKYHLEHHSDLGVESVDVDLPSWVEANYVTNLLAKLLYSICYMACYSLRPLLVKPKAAGKEDMLNASVVLIFDALLFAVCGWKSVLYLIAGIGLGGGLHPLAGHLIAEHFVFEQGQETYSYYGSANLLLYNVGYHNEHHDFPQIPGSRLHKLREIAPEYYNHLRCHHSYFWVLWQFITNPAIGPWSRLKRSSRNGELSPVMGSAPVGKALGARTHMVASSGFKAA